MENGQGTHTFIRDGVVVKLIYDTQDDHHFGVSFDGGLPQQFVSVDARTAYIDWRFELARRRDSEVGEDSSGLVSKPLLRRYAPRQTMAEVRETGILLCDACGKPHTRSMSNICHACDPLAHLDGGPGWRPREIQ